VIQELFVPCKRLTFKCLRNKQIRLPAKEVSLPVQYAKYRFSFHFLLAASMGLMAIGTLAHAEKVTPEPAPDHNQVLYLEPMAMILVSSYMTLNTQIFSMGYERRLGSGPASLLVNLHGGYSEEDNNYDGHPRTDYAIGFGLGFRRYIGDAFSGSYLTVQSDYIRGEKWGTQYNYNPSPIYDQLGNSIYQPYPTEPFSEKQFLSMSQISYGYKFQWKYIVVDLSLGGAFYLTQDEAKTNLIGGANLGVPFNASAFGL
jgi:hypothetical protein